MRRGYLARRLVTYPGSPATFPMIMANTLLKPLPLPKAQTTWQKFATKKGIKAKTSEEKKNLRYNEETGEWERKWGYKGANKAGENDWIVEVDENKERERKEGTERQGDGRRERKEKIRRNERLQRSNERRSKKNHGGK